MRWCGRSRRKWAGRSGRCDNVGKRDVGGRDGGAMYRVRSATRLGGVGGGVKLPLLVWNKDSPDPEARSRSCAETYITYTNREIVSSACCESLCWMFESVLVRSTQVTSQTI